MPRIPNPPGHRIPGGGYNGISFQIKTANDLRRLLQRVTNQYLRDEISSAKFRDIMYGAPQLLDTIKLSSLEEKVGKLESENSELTVIDGGNHESRKNA